MRQCNNYEEAMHYDCAECDIDNCLFRKDTGIPTGALFVLVLIIIIVGLILFT